MLVGNCRLLMLLDMNSLSLTSISFNTRKSSDLTLTNQYGKYETKCESWHGGMAAAGAAAVVTPWHHASVCLDKSHQNNANTSPR